MNQTCGCSNSQLCLYQHFKLHWWLLMIHQDLGPTQQHGRYLRLSTLACFVEITGICMSSSRLRLSIQISVNDDIF